ELGGSCGGLRQGPVRGRRRYGGDDGLQHAGGEATGSGREHGPGAGGGKGARRRARGRGGDGALLEHRPLGIRHRLGRRSGAPDGGRAFGTGGHRRPPRSPLELRAGDASSSRGGAAAPRDGAEGGRRGRAAPLRVRGRHGDNLLPARPL
ncbi:MAG: hypothetical protein AVDCRST_MAG05-2732, partial [uncultured Rubrobacteraceae bacterium]